MLPQNGIVLHFMLHCDAKILCDELSVTIGETLCEVFLGYYIR